MRGSSENLQVLSKPLKQVLLGQGFCPNCCKKPLLLTILHFLMTRILKKYHRENQIYFHSDPYFSKQTKSLALPICCIIRDPIKQSCCYAHPYTYAHSLRRTKRKPDNAFHGHPHFNAGIQQTSLCTDRNASLHKELQPPSDIYTAYSALSRPL